MDGVNSVAANGSQRVFLFRREQSQSLSELFAALAKAKLEPEWCSQIKKNAKAQYGAFVNMAGLLAATEFALAKNALIVDQTFHFDADAQPVLLVTEIGHGGSGQFMRSILPIPRVAKAQEQKSAITYMRRAAYESILGLAPSDPSDDDGDAASTGSPSTNGNGDGQWQRVELMARQKIVTAKTKDELRSLLNRVQKRSEAGELPDEAVERLTALADVRSRELSKESTKG
jgi:hypothetical protein